jgi:hypothetical protein
MSAVDCVESVRTCACLGSTICADGNGGQDEFVHHTVICRGKRHVILTNPHGRRCRHSLPYALTARTKRLGVDAWNTGSARVALAYTPDSVCGNRAEFLQRAVPAIRGVPDAQGGAGVSTIA